MSDRMKWIDRTFAFDFPVEESARLVDRLRDTPDRLEALVESLPESVLVRRDGDTWSIQENAGHLADVEALFIGRLEDYRARADTLRPAEMSGRRTFAARHNERPLPEVLAGFRREREAFVASLEGLEPESFGWSAIHPRLEQRMRLCDMLHFMAEHDDHHLARIAELIARFGSASGG